MTLLLDHGAEIALQDPHGKTPLLLVVRGVGRRDSEVARYEEVVRLLLNRDADFYTQDTSGHTALYYASGEGNVKVVKWLLQQDRANRQEHGEREPLSILSALHHAQKHGHKEVVQVLRTVQTERA